MPVKPIAAGLQHLAARAGATGALLACICMTLPFPMSSSAQTTPEPATQSAPAAFFVIENGVAAGPFDLAELGQRGTAGTLKPDTLVWTNGQPDWAAASNLIEIAGLFPAAFAPANIALPDFFTGRWVQEGALPLPDGSSGMAHITTEYRADLTFSLNGTISNAAMNTPLTLSGEGIWSVTRQSDTTFDVTLAGLLRMQGAQNGASQLLNQQTRIEVVDQSTLRDPATGALLQRMAD